MPLRCLLCALLVLYNRVIMRIGSVGFTTMMRNVRLIAMIAIIAAVRTLIHATIMSIRKYK